jgi:hypothetical protein
MDHSQADARDEVQPAAQRLADSIRTPLRPGDPRMHHYIPRFMLRRFAKDDRVARITLDAPREYEVAATDKVAVVKDLYTTVDSDETVGETVSVERLLAQIDGMATNATERLLGGVLFPPSFEDRANLALWFALLHVRGPANRRHMEAMADQAYKMQLSLIHDEDDARRHLTAADGIEPTDEEIALLLRKSKAWTTSSSSRIRTSPSS